METEDVNWSWPEEGRPRGSLVEEVCRLDSPYERTPPPFCYPGTPLDPALLALAGPLLAKQINAIGTHTHYDALGEGGFETVQRMEAQTLSMIASVVGGNLRDVDGYFCGGGTEANIEGMWIAREWLRSQRLDIGVKGGIVIFITPLAHYSLCKAAELLDITDHKNRVCEKCGRPHLFVPSATGDGIHLVGMNERGEMLVEKLWNMFLSKYKEGFRRFIVVPTVGTTVLGSIDPIAEIGALIEDMQNYNGKDAKCYMHVDASFGGFTVPFVNPSLPIGFQNPSVMSMALDADKMGQLPYPAGIFLCRKDLQKYTSRKVGYVRGNHDDTLCGSRSCLASVLGWLHYQMIGKCGQRQYVEQCLKARDRLVDLIKKEFPHGKSKVTIMPYSQWVNFLPLEIDIEKGEVPERICEAGILAPYQLRADGFPRDPMDVSSCPRQIYKICVMPHTIQFIEIFVDDVKRVFQSRG